MSDDEIQIIELAKKLGVKINIEDTKVTLDNAFKVNKNDTREMLRENVKLMDTKYFHNKFKKHVIINQKFLYTENSDCKTTIDNFIGQVFINPEIGLMLFAAIIFKIFLNRKIAGNTEAVQV